jgi:hypothetical protein
MGAGSGVGDLIELSDAFEIGDGDLIDVSGSAVEGSSAAEFGGEGVRGRRMARNTGGTVGVGGAGGKSGKTD